MGCNQREACLSRPPTSVPARCGEVDRCDLTRSALVDPSVWCGFLQNCVASVRRVILAFLLLFPDAFLANGSVLAEETAEIQVMRTADQVRFGIIRKNSTLTRAPTLLVIAHGIEEMQREPIYTDVARRLAEKGWISVILEPPCHGEDIREGEPSQLQGWRHRLENQEEFVKAFVLRASKVLDHLIQEEITDPDRVAVCGTSRGGFLAFHLAAADPRLKAAAGISPVTRLMALDEFSKTGLRPHAEKLDVANLAAKLANRPLWLSIGNHDLRVNTDDAIKFTRQVVLASVQSDKPAAVIPIELIVAPTAGHSQIDHAHEKLAQWLIDHVTPGN